MAKSFSNLSDGLCFSYSSFTEIEKVRASCSEELLLHISSLGYPSHKQLLEISNEAGMDIDSVRCATAEMWRQAYESRHPRSRGSQRYSDSYIDVCLTRADRRLDQYFILLGGLAYWEDGSFGTTTMQNDPLALAMKTHVLANGGSFFHTFDEFCDMAPFEDWEGVSQFIEQLKDVGSKKSDDG